MGMDCIIFDIDGTLSDVSHRRHFVTGPKKDYDSFYDAMVDDPINMPIAYLAEVLAEFIPYDTEGNGAGEPPYALFICTGRPETHRAQTETWLMRNVPRLWEQREDLLMRPAKDYRPDNVLKEEMLATIRGRGFSPVLVVDDRQRVVDMWRRNGITCLQCDDSGWDKKE